MGQEDARRPAGERRVAVKRETGRRSVRATDTNLGITLS